MMQSLQIKNKSTVYFDSINNLSKIRDFSNNKTVLFASKSLTDLSNQIIKILEGVGADLYVYFSDDGEENKTLEKALTFTQFLAYNDIGRNDVIINIGGGTLCDLGAFVASVYMRGIEYINIPTTLLCAVDACIGGKTAINAIGAKNLWGSFYHPKMVLVDCDFLKNISNELISEGMSEIVKYAILDGEFESFLNQFEDISAVKASLDEVIMRSLAIKARFVELDEFDRNERKLLNLGHTIAHAIEKFTDYETEHSAAVACGLICETKIAFNAGCISAKRRDAILSLCDKFLRVEIPVLNSEVISLMGKDKKNYEDKIVFSMPAEIGAIVKGFSREELIKLL